MERTAWSSEKLKYVKREGLQKAISEGHKFPRSPPTTTPQFTRDGVMSLLYGNQLIAMRREREMGQERDRDRQERDRERLADMSREIEAERMQFLLSRFM